MSTSNIHSKMITVNQAKAAIESGKVLWVAGDEGLLKQLPKGRWIGGSIPYFMSADGGKTTRDMIYVSELDPSVARRIQVKFYNAATIQNIAKDSPEDGFTILLMPAFSDIHSAYAENAPEYEDMFIKPIAGWITGIHLDDLGTVKPSVFNGGTCETSTDKAVAMHVTLAPNKVANIGIVNIAKQGDGDAFEFLDTGFSASSCLVNGVEQNFSDYLLDNNIDTKLPLVADYSGAMINVSVMEIDEEKKSVSFYAPVFSGVEYKIAMPVDDYVSSFQSSLPSLDSSVTFSCNCVLNYLYSELEGKTT
ncbi:MAG: hypothetical protein O7D86_04925 [Proteobacteria bacterium]|nr:hypothetical protein [Pseudomonadota bacterium]